MAEYIKKEDIEQKIQDGLNNLVLGHDAIEVLGMIYEMPAADVATVRHARWVTPHWHNSDYCYNCSECGGEAMHREYQWARNGIYPICPNCGAKMDGGAD